MQDKIMTITLVNKGMVAYVSNRDYDKAMQHQWQAFGDGRGKYRACLYRPKSMSKKERNYIFLHRYILDLEDPSHIIRFIDGNKLNCIRENMKLVIIDGPKNGRPRGHSLEADTMGIAVSCGRIVRAEETVRCIGLGIQGRPHCPNYDDCLQLCIDNCWPGFRSIGERK